MQGRDGLGGFFRGSQEFPGTADVVGRFGLTGEGREFPNQGRPGLVQIAGGRRLRVGPGRLPACRGLLLDLLWGRFVYGRIRFRRLGGRAIALRLRRLGGAARDRLLAGRAEFLALITEDRIATLIAVFVRHSGALKEQLAHLLGGLPLFLLSFKLPAEFLPLGFPVEIFAHDPIDTLYVEKRYGRR